MKLKLKLKKEKVLKEIVYCTNLKDFLYSKNKTMADLSKAVGFSRAYITDINKERRPVPKKVLEYLSNL